MLAKPLLFLGISLVSITGTVVADTQKTSNAAPSDASSINGPSAPKTSDIQSDKLPVLPSPLTLESLMALPAETSPQLLKQIAQQDYAESQYQLKKSEDDFEVNVLGRLGWREYGDRTEDNHLLALHIGKELYDFGGRTSAIKAEAFRAEAEKSLYEDVLIRYQLKLMRSFFNVILSDLRYRVENEAMAIAYVSMDKAKDQHELNRLSDVDYLKMQADYEAVLVRRNRASYDQRKTRAKLMNLVGQPDNLPDKLTFPELKHYQNRKLDTLEAYQQKAIDQNIRLQSLRVKHKAALKQLESASATNKPTFRADAWAGKLSSYQYERDGRWRFDLTMDMPLYDGGSSSARKSGARAQIRMINAEMQSVERSLRDQVADVYFSLQTAEAERKQLKAEGDYADLYFDFSRAVYENELKTDLGDAMVRLSQSNYDLIQQQFTETLYWAQLDYLTGQPVILE